MISIEEAPDHQGEDAWRIITPTATYVFHKESAGFASLIDPDGADWIQYRPGGGSAGEFRGVPNLGREDGAFHPGRPGGCRSIIDQPTSDAVIIRSETEDGVWATVWRIGPESADLEVTRAGHPFWFLYEGTPGGAYREDEAYLVDSSGARYLCTDRWEKRLPDPRWINVATPASDFTLLLADLTRRPSNTLDSFFSMEENMTVFGFGRTLDHESERWMHLAPEPSRFTIAILPFAKHAILRNRVNELLASVEAAET